MKFSYPSLATPLRLTGVVKDYAWGQSRQHSTIRKFFKESDSLPDCCAELWFGCHKNGTSQVIIHEKKKSLSELISEQPTEILGQDNPNISGPSLPFLVKILSIASPLSIQAHPNQLQAEDLHRRDPEHYPDSNQKPEAAIAISETKLLYGMIDVGEILTLGKDFPLFMTLAQEGDRTQPNQFLQKIWATILQSSDDSIHSWNLQLYDEVNHKTVLSEKDQLYLSLREKVEPSDRGLILLYLMNLSTLPPGEVIFIAPGVPHAYIQGEVIECMANSDNVVRVGLTSKFQDRETLLQIMHFQPQRLAEAKVPPGAGSNSGIHHYRFPALEFALDVLSQGAVERHAVVSSEILLSLEGSIQISESQSLQPYQAVFIPACIKHYEVEVQSGLLYRWKIGTS